jgi:hypothetical protein
MLDNWGGLDAEEIAGFKNDVAIQQAAAASTLRTFLRSLSGMKISFISYVVRIAMCSQLLLDIKSKELQR